MGCTQHHVIKQLARLAIVYFCVISFPALFADTPTLNVLVAVQNPPYMIDIEAQQGIDLEIISLVHGEMGYKTRFTQGHFRRQSDMLKRTDIDAMSTWMNDNVSHCHSSQPYRYWLNAVMVSRDSAINTIDDLSDQAVASFHGAENVLNDYQVITRNMKSVSIAENSMQAAHMIKASRVSAYLGDYVAFYYALRNKYSDDVAKKYSRIIHYFKKTEQIICYKAPEVTKQFNQAFQRLDNQGKITAIISKYVELPELTTE